LGENLEEGGKKLFSDGCMNRCENVKRLGGEGKFIREWGTFRMVVAKGERVAREKIV